MSKMSLGVHTYLQTVAAVTAASSGGGFADAPEPNPDFPFYVYREISYDPTYHLTGCDFAQTRMQVDCYGLSPTTAEDLREAVRKAVNNYAGAMGAETVHSCNVDSRFNDYEPPLHGQGAGRFIRSIDFVISHLETS
jgi:hypothetical protein